MLRYAIIDASDARRPAFRLEVNGRELTSFASEPTALATARALAQLDHTAGDADVVVTIQRRDGSVELLEVMTGDVLSYERDEPGRD